MIDAQNMLTRLEILSAIANLPDDTSVTQEIAGLFLGMSPKSLGRYRQGKGESGPKYVQYPVVGSKARNQTVTYIMRELRLWRESNRVSSTMDAAVRRGMACFCIEDLAIGHPLWTCDDGIINHAFCVNIEEFSNYLNDPNVKIEWLHWPDSLPRKWISNATREQFNKPYLDLLNSLIKASNQA